MKCVGAIVSNHKLKKSENDYLSTLKIRKIENSQEKLGEMYIYLFESDEILSSLIDPRSLTDCFILEDYDSYHDNYLVSINSNEEWLPKQSLSSVLEQFYRRAC